MKQFLLCVTMLCLVTALLSAQQVAIKTYEKVTPTGVETIQEIGPYIIDAQGRVQPNSSSPSLLWTYPDNGLLWIARSISIGDRGTQVCAICELNNERVELLSVNDDNPPVPIWTDTSLLGTDAGYMCSSTSKGDYHAVMYQVNQPDVMNRVPMVNYYKSDTVNPLWTWSYGTTINAGSKVAVDRDGTIVAIAVFNNNTSMIDLFFIDPTTGNVTSTYSQASGGLRGFDFSADGSTLYFHDGRYDVYIYDVATGTVTFNTQTGGSFDGHCISGDGTKFAFGGFGNVTVWENNLGNWSSFVYSTGSGNYGDEMDFSDDGSTLGFGVSQYSPSYTKCEGLMMDVASQTIVSHAIWDSAGSTYQDVCSAAAISRDGQYFALARWGDQFGTNSEVYTMEWGNNTPVGSIDCRGSAFAADLSADGQVTVSGCKSVHANVSGNGGDVDCWDLGNEDVILHGKVIVGGSFQLEIYGTPGWYYAPFYGTDDVPEGITTPVGTLYIDNSPGHQLKFLSPKVMPPSAVALDTINVPNLPTLVGQTRYMQVVLAPTAAQKHLSKDYVALTVLP